MAYFTSTVFDDFILLPTHTKYVLSILLNPITSFTLKVRAQTKEQWGNMSYVYSRRALPEYERSQTLLMCMQLYQQSYIRIEKELSL